MITNFLFAEVAFLKKKMIQGNDLIGPNYLRRIHYKIGLKINKSDLVKSKRKQLIRSARRQKMAIITIFLNNCCSRKSFFSFFCFFFFSVKLLGYDKYTEAVLSFN